MQNRQRALLAVACIEDDLLAGLAVELRSCQWRTCLRRLYPRQPAPPQMASRGEHPLRRPALVARNLCLLHRIGGIFDGTLP